MYTSQGGASRGEELRTEFCSVFCLVFFPGVREWGDRASSRGLVLRLGLRHRRSDPIVITDRSSSLCVDGPPGSIRWDELGCGASPPRRRIVGAPAAPPRRALGSTTSAFSTPTGSWRRRRPHARPAAAGFVGCSFQGRSPRRRSRRQARPWASPGGTAAPGSWIHHVGVLNADRVLAPPATACAAGGGWFCWALLSGPFASSAISSTG